MMTKTKNNNKAWIIFFIFFITGLLISANNDKVSASMVLLMGDLGIGAASAGLLITVAAVIGGIAAVPIGALMVKTGPKAMAIGSILLALTGCLIGALLPNYSTLMVSRVFDGIAMGVIATVVPTVVAANFPEEKRGLPMGIWSCYVSIGYILVLQSAAILGDESNPHTWVNLWWALAVAFIIVLVLFIFLTKGNKKPDTVEETAEKEEKVSLIEGFKSVPTIFIMLVELFFAMTVAVGSSYLPAYCNGALGLDILKANSLTSLMSASMLVAGILMGFVLNKTKRHYTIFLICAICAASFGAMSFLFPANLATIFMIVLGLSQQAMFATLFTLAPGAAKSPETVSVTMGLLSFGQLMAGLAVTAGGIIIDTSGFATCSHALGICGIIFVIFTILFTISMKKKQNN